MDKPHTPSPGPYCGTELAKRAWQQSMPAPRHVTVARTIAAMRSGRASLLTCWLRRLRLVLHLFRGIAKVALLFPFLDSTQKQRAVTRWARQLLSAAGVQVVHPDVDTQFAGSVVAANHVSWLDIFVIQSLHPVRFVAKSEIRAWPLIGWLCARTGTLFIERERRHHTARINEVMRDVLQAGGTVGLFPEGTTTDGDQLKKFHSALFEASIIAAAPLLPAGIVYRNNNGQRSIAAAYVGDTSLLESMLAITGEAGINAELRFGAPIHPAGLRRRDLALRAEAAVAALIDVPMPRSHLLPTAPVQKAPSRTQASRPA